MKDVFTGVWSAHYMSKTKHMIDGGCPQRCQCQTLTNSAAIRKGSLLL